MKIAKPRQLSYHRDFPSLAEAMDNPSLFQKWFSGSSWDNWRSVLKATFAQPMTAEEITFFRTVSGDRSPPARRVREAWFICGRGAGKDSTASVVAAHAAASFDPSPLRPGERAAVMCFAKDRDQAKIIFRYTKAFFEMIPSLAGMVERVADSDGVIELCNAVDIIVMTGSFRSVRGRPILCAILDEVAFFTDENSATPDVELSRALLPGMRLPTSMMIGISSPYKKSGLLFDRHRKHFGRDSDDVLVIQAASHVMNPILDLRERDRMMVEDPAAAQAEYFAQFRDDLVNFIDAAVVDRCVVEGRTELMTVSGVIYSAAVDPSGGSSDSMTLAIAHSEGDRGILDIVVECRPPFSPEAVVIEFATILKAWGITSVVGDNYGGMWPKERFAMHGISYELAGMTRSEAYLTLLPALNTPQRIELLDNRRLVSQLCSLERRVARSGRDSVDHPRGAHDDLINAAALALVKAALAERSSADNWLAYMRGLAIEAGLDPNEIEADAGVMDVDVEDLRPAAEYGWRFHDHRNFVSVRVPEAFVRDRQIYFAGQQHNIMPHGDLGPGIQVRKQDIAGLLKAFPAIAAANAELARDLGAVDYIIQRKEIS
jgi:hypothetical protein